MGRDTPRLLHRHSHYGYTDRPEHALFQEPEAVSADTQRDLTTRAHRAAQQAQVAEWMVHRAEIERRLAWLYSQRFRRDVTRSCASCSDSLIASTRRCGRADRCIAMQAVGEDQ